MARPRKQHGLKIISGTARPDRTRDEDLVEDLDLVEGKRDPPDWLSTPFAKNAWRRLQPELAARGRLTVLGLDALGVLCELQGQIEDKARRQVEVTGFLVSQWRALQNDFGLIKTAGTRAKAPQGKNKFAGIGRR